MGFVEGKTDVEYHQTYPFKYIFLSEAEHASCVCCVSCGGESVLIPDLLLTNKKTYHWLPYDTPLESSPPSVSWSKQTQTLTGSYTIKNVHDVLKTFKPQVEKKWKIMLPVEDSSLYCYTELRRSCLSPAQSGKEEKAPNAQSMKNKSNVLFVFVCPTGQQLTSRKPY